MREWRDTAGVVAWKLGLLLVAEAVGLTVVIPAVEWIAHAPWQVPTIAVGVALAGLGARSHWRVRMRLRDQLDAWKPHRNTGDLPARTVAAGAVAVVVAVAAGVLALGPADFDQRVKAADFGLKVAAGVLAVIAAWVTIANHSLARRTASSERVKRAAESLSGDSAADRLGALAVLRTAAQDRYEARAVAEVLSAFLRERSEQNRIQVGWDADSERWELSDPSGHTESVSPGLKDCHVAFDGLLLAERHVFREYFQIDVPNTTLMGLFLTGDEPFLMGALLNGCDLRSAIMDEWSGEGVGFRGAVLRGALLRRAHFVSSDFRGADLSHAVVGGMTLIECDLRGARLVDLRVSKGDVVSLVRCIVDETTERSGDWVSAAVIS